MNTESRDPFGLSELPGLQSPADGWIGLASQLQQERRRRQQWLSGLAIAATITLVVGVVSILPPTESGPVQSASLAQQPTVQPVEIADTGDEAQTIAELGTDNLQSLQKLSQRLEKNLGYLRSGLGAMPAEMVVYQVELEDLVAQVDAAISQQPDSSQLWQQRVNLLMDLNQVYGAGLRRDDPYVASL